MREAGLIIVTSIKEGWGLIVTEANSQGTPAIAYDTDGLRDSIKDKVTGLLVSDGDYKKLGEKLSALLEDQATYNHLRYQAWRWSQGFTFENSYKDFLNAIDLM
jgi:glycosyltransferase involved in cell wall biosynthesis